MKEKSITASMKKRIAFNYFGMDELPEGISEDEVKELAKNLDKSSGELSDKDLEAELEIMDKYLNDKEDETKPSEETKDYWIYAESDKNDYPEPTSRSGKWLIFVNKKDVDEVWQKIKNATEEGSLGSISKVATAKPNPNAIDTNKRVICVYTYDSTDKNDVMRIRNELRKLGITNKIPYKEDSKTLSGKYQVKGDCHISKYFE